VPPGARAAEALARRSDVLDVLICFSRISRSSRCVETIEPWECVATKIASAAWRSSIHWLFAVRLVYNLRKKKFKDISVSEELRVYALIDAFANGSLSF
jgi:hypothetical protein